MLAYGSVGKAGFNPHETSGDKLARQAGLPVGAQSAALATRTPERRPLGLEQTPNRRAATPTGLARAAIDLSLRLKLAANAVRVTKVAQG